MEIKYRDVIMGSIVCRVNGNNGETNGQSHGTLHAI